MANDRLKQILDNATIIRDDAKSLERKARNTKQLAAGLIEEVETLQSEEDTRKNGRQQDPVEEKQGP